MRPEGKIEPIQTPRSPELNLPADLRYTTSHEWVRMDGDVATIGITDFAQSELGDVVYVDLPTVGPRTVEGAAAAGAPAAAGATGAAGAPAAGADAAKTAAPAKKEEAKKEPAKKDAKK